ncbi:hypothetical protein RJT34_16613 [Clitoria ternatea]|uniref:Uncharacterized protein n=1 Tax=Clitoria ternatea TaxID=43366 RepID=A0AAN9J7I0_CLITE
MSPASPSPLHFLALFLQPSSKEVFFEIHVFSSKFKEAKGSELKSWNIVDDGSRHSYDDSRYFVVLLFLLKFLIVRIIITVAIVGVWFQFNL